MICPHCKKKFNYNKLPKENFNEAEYTFMCPCCRTKLISGLFHKSDIPVILFFVFAVISAYFIAGRLGTKSPWNIVLYGGLILIFYVIVVKIENRIKPKIFSDQKNNFTSGELPANPAISEDPLMNKIRENLKKAEDRFSKK